MAMAQGRLKVQKLEEAGGVSCAGLGRATRGFQTPQLSTTGEDEFLWFEAPLLVVCCGGPRPLIQLGCTLHRQLPCQTHGLLRAPDLLVNYLQVGP